MLRNLIVRADATKRVGTGHVMRCLAIGQEWKKRGGEVTFFSYLENVSLRDRIISEGFRLISMDRKHPDPSDLGQVLDFLRNDRDVNDISWLVLDGYHFGADYQASVRETGIRLLVIDDYNHLPRYHADILLNQNIGAEKISYMTDPYTICLFGPKYALLRSEFIAWRDGIKEKSQPVSNILVTMGGTDPDNITLKVFRFLLQAGLKGFEINIVAGQANPNIEKLDHEIDNAAKTKIPAAKRIHLHKNANMPKLIAEADFAITAGGSTCWELCFFGVPFMVIVAAENQRDVARELDRVGASVSLGWHEGVKAANLISAANELIYEPDKLRSMSLIGRRIVDGQGCGRILDLINWLDTATDRNDIQLRKASEKDTLQLWKLANEKEVRRNSFSPDPISYDEHVKWFREKLESKSSVIYVLNISGVLLAQVRYDRKGDAAEIDYAVIPGFRGKNLGTKILVTTWEMARRELKVKRVRAVVKKDNKDSISSLLKAGFEKTASENYSGFDCVFFERNI